MSVKNIDMSKIKQVMHMLLQRRADGRHPSNREIGRTVGLYKGTVNDYVRRIEADPLPIEVLLELDDLVLERRRCARSAAYNDLSLARRLARCAPHCKITKPNLVCYTYKTLEN